MESAVPILETVVEALGRASLQGAVAIAAVWLVCRLFPRLPASLRCGLWWLACLKLLVALVWAEPIALPVLPAAEPAPQAQVLTLGGGALSRSAGEGRGGGLAVEAAGPAPAFPWLPTLAALWAAGLLLQSGITARQLAAARRIVRGAEPVGEGWLTALFTDLRERLGVRRADLLASPEVETPQVTGALHPRVLLPRREIGRLTEQELALTLCHELLHVRRGDLWLGWVPALAQRLFFFHPLAALAAREYAVAREAACDAAVLRLLDPAPETYGRLLLRLGVNPRVPHMAAAGAAPTFQTLKRRLEMLQQASEKKRFHPGWWGLVALLALTALVPFRMVAQEAAPADPPEAGEPAAPAEPAEPGEPAEPAEPGRPAELATPGRPTEPAAPGRPAQPAHPALPPAPASSVVPPAPPAPVTPPLPVAAVAQVRGVPPAPPAPPPAPPAPPAPPRGAGYRHVTSEDGEHESYVLLYDESSAVMSGSTSDMNRAKKLRGNVGEPILYFERNGKRYVVRDAATLARAKALFEPQMELGEKQAALGDQQAKLGDQQARIGEQMAAMGARQAEHGARMAAQAMKDGDDAAVDRIEADMEALSEKMEDLGRKMEELGRKQEALGDQQEELGRRQEKLAGEAEKQLRGLMDQALSSGLAKEVDG